MSQAEYSIKVACQLSGVNEHTLRSWEKRYEILQPKRSQTGRRIYTESDIDKLRYIKRLIEDGHSISFIAGKNVDSLKTLMLKSEALKESPQAEPDTLNSMITDNLVDVDEYVIRIQKFIGLGNEVEVERLIRTARLKTNNLFYITKFIPAILKKIGDKVFVDDFGIWQEHIVSSIVRIEMFAMYKELKMNNSCPSYQKRAIDMAISTMDGNYHEIGPLLAACLCELFGLKTLYLGPSSPSKDIIQMMNRLNVKKMVLGAVSLPLDKIDEDMEDCIRTLTEAGISPDNIILGGYIGPSDRARMEKYGVKMFAAVDELQEYISSQLVG